MNLFIYGTLRDKQVREMVLGRPVAASDLTKAYAPDFASFKVADVAYPCLLPTKGQIAEGLLLTGLSDDDIARLDTFEGVNYKRVPLSIMVGDKVQESYYYQPNDSLQTEGEWDLAQWQKHGKAAFLGDDFDPKGIRIPQHV